MGNFSDLPPELLRVILEKLKSIENLVRFGGVCHSWRQASLDARHDSLVLQSFKKRPRVPWLMLTANDNEDGRSFFSPSKKRVRHFELPEARGCHCWGSPFGWLLTLGFDQQLHLLNPFSCTRLPLPPLSTLKYKYFDKECPGLNRMNYIRRAIICRPTCFSSSASTCQNTQFIVFVMYSKKWKLAFARPGDRFWTTIVLFPDDILYLNDRFYSVNWAGIVSLIDIRVPTPVASKFASLPCDLGPSEKPYLVELRGQLHIVLRNLKSKQIDQPIEFHHSFKTVFFEVWKLDLCTREWEKLETIGDHAIFIGSNTSFSLVASVCQKCKPGCIYFTDDCEYIKTSGQLIGRDMGIFNLETKKFELQELYHGDDAVSRFSPPFWIIPNLL